jgi:hypothetical protein
MASVLEPVVFAPATFRKELTDFDRLLQGNSDLSERDEIIPFFKARKHLTAYIGALYLNIAVATEVCYEFDIGGSFRADILLGSKADGRFSIVEFEPGQEGALFKKQPRKYPEWSSRFEHAFSQIVDWFCGLADGANTNDFRDTFGDKEIKFASLLVMGREAELDDSKRRRLAWRTNKVLIDSNTVTCITFDQLHDELKRKYEFYAAAAEVETASTTPGLPPPPSTSGTSRRSRGASGRGR